VYEARRSGEHLSLYTGDRERDRSSSRLTDPSLVTRFVRSCTPVTCAGMHVARGGGGGARSAKGRGAGVGEVGDFLPTPPPPPQPLSSVRRVTRYQRRN